MKQKLCFHAVKAMLLHGHFRHIAAENKAVLLSKTVVLACFTLKLLHKICEACVTFCDIAAYVCTRFRAVFTAG